MDAFNLAEKFQTPVFVMSDLDLGMNNWMSDPFPYPEKPIERGKVLTKEDLDRLGGFSRYKDVDGDATIGYRTLPGTQHPAAAYFTRGSGHNAQGNYSERPEDYENNMARLRRKFENVRSFAPAPVVEKMPNAEIGIIAFGTTHWALTESRDQLRDEHKLATDYLRIRAFPFSHEIADFVASHKRVYVVEQNRDGQMFSLLRHEISITNLHSQVAERGAAGWFAARRAFRDRRHCSNGGKVNGDHTSRSEDQPAWAFGN